MARRRGARAGVLIIVGLIGLTSLFARPRFQTYHTVDVVQMIVSGMCFGVALAAILEKRETDGR